MFIRKMENKDIAGCAEILCAIYNNELWMCRWDKETAIEYLNDFFENKKFVGYVAEENNWIRNIVTSGIGQKYCRGFGFDFSEYEK